MTGEFSYDRQPIHIDLADSPYFTSLTSPETPTTPSMSRSSRGFLLQSPSQSVGSNSTLVSPQDSYKWSPISHGINAQSDTQKALPGPDLIDEDESGKWTGLNVSQTSLPPNQPRHSRISWLKTICFGKWSMIICFCAGVCLAVGHHCFYQSIDGNEATDQALQIRYLRIGSIFSISTKSCLVVATILAYRQRAWMVVRNKVHSVRAVDTLFGAAENLMELLSFTMLKNDLPCLILAIFVWTSPFIIVFTADTLTVDLRTQHESALCPSIRTLNFTHEESNDWNAPRTPENQTRIGLSLSSWNATSPARNISDPNFFDYWTSSSSQFQVVASQSLWGNDALMRVNATQEICGTGWNCSATVQFVAPGYNCTELARGWDDPIRDLDGQMPPFNLSDLFPNGNYTYIAAATGGAYPPQVLEEVSTGGMPLFAPPYPELLGTFRTDPMIWVGYIAAQHAQKKLEINSTFTPVVFGCVHGQMNYTIQFNWTNVGQTYKVKKSDYIGKVINTTFLPDEEALNWPLLDRTTATPEENYIFPRKRHQYRLAAAYYSMGARLREMINGTCMTTQIANTQAIDTRLFDPHFNLPVEDVQTKLREMYHDLIVSLINNPQFLVVSWAKEPWKPTGVAVGQEETNFPCERKRTVNSFVYHRMTLWSVYTIGISIALIAVMFGFVAATQDGRGDLREMIFSEIVSATRGRDLDEVRWDQHMDKKKVKVLYQKRPGSDPGRFVLRDVAELEQMGSTKRLIRRRYRRTGKNTSNG